MLIFSDHKVLLPEDRRWLVTRCRVWAAKLDKHLATLEAGRNPAQIRAEVDETIREVIKMLRERANELATRKLARRFFQQPSAS